MIIRHTKLLCAIRIDELDFCGEERYLTARFYGAAGATTK